MQDEREREHVEAEAAAKLASEATVENCYTWLGEDYSEYGLETCTFENYAVRIMRDGVIFDAVNEERRYYARARAMAYAEEPKGTLLFHSPHEDYRYGTGKTHLACAVLNQLRKMGKPGLFTTGTNLFNVIQARRDAAWHDERRNGPASRDAVHGYQDVLTRMYKTPLLVIDDIDKAPATPFRWQTYTEILNKRVNRGLPTVITTNVAVRTATDLEDVVGGAAASRLNVGLILVGIRSEDYRVTMIGE